MIDALLNWPILLTNLTKTVEAPLIRNKWIDGAKRISYYAIIFIWLNTIFLCKNTKVPFKTW